MRTDSVQVNSNTRVFAKHLPGGRRTSPDEIPSIFPWTVANKERKPPAVRHVKEESAVPNTLVDETAVLTTEVDGLKEILDPVRLKAAN